MFRLGEGLTATSKFFRPEAECSLKGLKKVSKIIEENLGVRLDVVATSALREAPGTYELIADAKNLGVLLRIISVDEEVRLAPAGVNGSIDGFFRRSSGIRAWWKKF